MGTAVDGAANPYRSPPKQSPPKLQYNRPSCDREKRACCSVFGVNGGGGGFGLVRRLIGGRLAGAFGVVLAAAAAARTIANAQRGRRVALSIDAKFEYKEKQIFKINKNEIIDKCPAEQTIISIFCINCVDGSAFSLNVSLICNNWIFTI